MIEQVYRFSRSDEKAIEKILFDEQLHYLHMVLPQGEGLPIHYSNSTVYMSVIRGQLSIGLDQQAIAVYPAGTMLKIPVDTQMNVQNAHPEVLELIVVKAPAPVV
ncbi:MAG TPA: hypothetical protein GXZ74_07100 [Tissierellia bacterium]|nr:hypothetical protein [Tissierellia bacterium]